MLWFNAWTAATKISPTRSGSQRVIGAVLAGIAGMSPGCSTLARHDLSTSVNTIAIQLQADHATVLTANVAGVDMLLQSDLGDSTSLILQQSALDAIKAVPTGETVKMQGTDGEFEVPTYKLPRIQIGSAVFTNVTARLDTSRKGYDPKEIYRGYLGTGLLKAYAVVLDYAHHSMMLLPGEDATVRNLCRGTEVKFPTGSPGWKGEAVTEVDTNYGRVIPGWDTAAP